MAQFNLVEKAVFTRLHQMVKQHNETQTNLRDKIRHGSLLTLKTLTQKAIKTLRKAIESPDMADSDNLPGVYTNRPEMANLTECGTRTVYDHLDKLEAGGFTYKRFRGRQHDFTVWINPWIMLGDNYPTPTIVDLSTTKNAGFQGIIRQTSPPISILESNHNCPKEDVKSVDKLSTLIGKFIPPPTSPLVGHIRNFILERAVDPLPVEAKKTLDTAPGGARADKTQPGMPGTDKGGDRAGNESSVRNSETTGPTSKSSAADWQTYQVQKRLVVSFWELARQKFWEKEYFSPETTKKILNMLWFDVFGSFSRNCPSETLSVRWFDIRVSQLEKAERYFLRKQWSVMPPLAYFSKAHFNQQEVIKQKGNFFHTDDWQRQDDLKRNHMNTERYMQNALKNVLLGKYPASYQGDRNKMTLSVYYRNLIAKKGFADISAQYEEQLTVMATVSKISQPA